MLETVSSALGVFGVVNSYLLGEDGDEQSAASGAQQAAGGGGTARSRPHRPALPWPVLVSLVQQVELLAEMIAEMLTGEQEKYTTVAAVEGLKAAMRLCALLEGGGHTLMGGVRSAAPAKRMVLDQGAMSLRSLEAFRRRARASVAGIGAGAALTAIEDGAGFAAEAVDATHAPWWLRLMRRRAKRSETGAGDARGGGQADSALEEARAQLIPRSPSLPPAVAAEVASARRARTAAEVLFVVRPVVYALMLRRYGRTTWLPWLTSLGIDLTSDSLRVHSRQRIEALLRLAAGAAGADQEGDESDSDEAIPKLAMRGMETDAAKAALVRALGHPQLQAERAETGRRRALLAYYLARSPVFDIIAKRPLEAVGRSAEGIPLLGTVVTYLVDIAVGSSYYYFYTSAL